MIDQREWAELRAVFNAAFWSCRHVTLTSVDECGIPLATPIGSLMLAEPGHAFYFEIFASGLGRRVHDRPDVSVLAVDARPLFWLHALLRGSFPRLPAVRLVGRAATTARPPSAEERLRWQRRVAWVSWLRGGRLLWSRLDRVRDLWIDRIDCIQLGRMTAAVRL